ncbi:MAG TPA: hypothetical protein VIV60_13785 [Polyangiaceae bacterium]
MTWPAKARVIPEIDQDTWLAQENESAAEITKVELTPHVGEQVNPGELQPTVAR